MYARVAGYSPMESVNYSFDRWFVRIIKHGSDSSPDEPQGGVSEAVGTRKALKVRILVYGLLILLAIAALVPLGFDLDKLNLPDF